jgi:hypothetical protein
MAALANIFRRATGAPARNAATTPAESYRLRELPNEDLYFYGPKPIDNSRLVRASDPGQTGRDFSAIGALSAVAVIVITLLGPSVGGLMANWQIADLEKEQLRLINENRRVEAEVAQRESEENLMVLADRFGMKPPAAGQVVDLAHAEEGELASLKKPKR